MNTRIVAWTASIGLACLLFPSVSIAQAPTTVEEIGAMIASAVENADAIKGAKQQDSNLRAQKKVLMVEIDRHNANQCKYEEGHPEQCDWYEAERVTLGGEYRVLLGKVDENNTVERNERLAFNMRMSLLRMSKIIGGDTGLDEWVTEVVRCSKLPSPAAAATCLKAAWERHP
jgi:hypothetical protein